MDETQPLKTPLERAIEHLDPPKKAELARICGQFPQAVTRWLRTGRVPAHHCLTIERATGGKVTCHDLRPDVFAEPDSELDSAA
jgi:DNA-binding transcriptional regulator YdaS (Cro superfamily)